MNTQSHRLTPSVKLATAPAGGRRSVVPSQRLVVFAEGEAGGSGGGGRFTAHEPAHVPFLHAVALPQYLPGHDCFTHASGWHWLHWPTEQTGSLRKILLAQVTRRRRRIMMTVLGGTATTVKVKKQKLDVGLLFRAHCHKLSALRSNSSRPMESRQPKPSRREDLRRNLEANHELLSLQLCKAALLWCYEIKRSFRSGSRF